MKARTAGTALGALAALLAAGCGATTTTAANHPSPSASHAASTATIIATAFSSECAGFDTAYSTIQTATQGQTTVGQLMATLTGGVGNTATGWSNQVSAAAKHADAPGVPEGKNKARELAFKIDAVGLALANLQVDADFHKLGKIPGAWRTVLSEIDGVRSAGCS